MAAARGRNPVQQPGHRDRIGQTPACVAAARWADQDRLVGHPEITKHVLVGQVIAEGNQAGFSA